MFFQASISNSPISFPLCSRKHAEASLHSLLPCGLRHRFPPSHLQIFSPPFAQHIPIHFCQLLTSRKTFYLKIYSVLTWQGQRKALYLTTHSHNMLLKSNEGNRIQVIVNSPYKDKTRYKHLESQLPQIYLLRGQNET